MLFLFCNLLNGCGSLVLRYGVLVLMSLNKNGIILKFDIQTLTVIVSMIYNKLTIKKRNGQDKLVTIMKSGVVLSLFLTCSFFNALNAQLANEVNQYMVYQPLVNYAASSSYQTINGAMYYRNQWVGFKGAPVGYGGAISVPLPKKNITLGLSVLRDKIGVRTNDAIDVNLAYKFKINRKSAVSFSLSPQVRFLTGNLDEVVTTDLQDPNFSEVYKSGVIPNFKFGAYYFRSNFYVGGAIPGMLRNEIDIISGATKVSTSFELDKLNWFLHSGYLYNINKKNDVSLSVLLKEGSGASLHMEANAMWLLMEKKFGIGASYRTSKDVVGILNFQFLEQWRLSYAYQYSFGNISNYQSGSHEVMLVFELASKRNYVKLNAPRF